MILRKDTRSLIRSRKLLMKYIFILVCVMGILSPYSQVLSCSSSSSFILKETGIIEKILNALTRKGLWGKYLTFKICGIHDKKRKFGSKIATIENTYSDLQYLKEVIDKLNRCKRITSFTRDVVISEIVFRNNAIKSAIESPDPKRALSYIFGQLKLPVPNIFSPLMMESFSLATNSNKYEYRFKHQNPNDTIDYIYPLYKELTEIKTRPTLQMKKQTPPLEVPIPVTLNPSVDMSSYNPLPPLPLSPAPRSPNIVQPASEIYRLPNIGNSCYMNSILSVFLHRKDISPYEKEGFINPREKELFNNIKQNPSDTNALRLFRENVLEIQDGDQHTVGESLSKKFLPYFKKIQSRGYRDTLKKFQNAENYEIEVNFKNGVNPETFQNDLKEAFGNRRYFDPPDILPISLYRGQLHFIDFNKKWVIPAVDPQNTSDYDKCIKVEYQPVAAIANMPFSSNYNSGHYLSYIKHDDGDIYRHSDSSVSKIDPIHQDHLENGEFINYVFLKKVEGQRPRSENCPIQR